jgi:DUF3035 family protein
MTSPRLLIVLGLAALALSACSEVRESLGLGRSPPDEFAVVDRPPLSMPPDFGLRPPQPGAPRPQEVDMKQRANDVLFAGNGSDKSTTTSGAEVSGSEKALLEQTGATKADPNIRSIVDRETAEKAVGTTHLVDELLWWKSDEKPAATVDAPAEAERIKDAKEKGEPLNKGGTPVIEREKSGWLGL